MRAGHVLGDDPAHAAQRLAAAPPSAAPPEAARRTSSSVTRPCGPVPASPSMPTPSSWATLRTSGVARARSAVAPNRLVVDHGRRLAGAASPPIETSTVPTGTTSPSATKMRDTTPAAGDGISTVALSVWISTSGSSSAISCPSVTSQRATSPSVRPSPRSGSLNSYATSGHSRERTASWAAWRGRPARG